MKELKEYNINEISKFFYYMNDMMKTFSNLIYSESVFNEIEINISEELKLKK
jgi:hypothetical protein